MRFFRKRNADRDLDTELAFHLDRQIEEFVSDGLPREEAHRRAMLEFGGVQQTKESIRDTKWFAHFETFFRDIRFGIRMLAKSWGLTLVVTITLALGIGVNTAVFSVLNGWLLRPLPVPMPGRIVVLASQQKGRTDSQFSYPAFEDLRRQADSFSDLFVFALGVGALSNQGKAVEFAYSAVSSNYFSTLGVKPACGQFFLPGESDKQANELLVVLGYAYWKKTFGGNCNVVGRQVRVNGAPATVIGVVPQEFHGTLFAFEMDGYLPIAVLSKDRDSHNFWDDRHVRPLNILGRLKSGVSNSQAQTSMDVIARRVSAAFPESDEGLSIRIIPERLARPAPLIASFVPVIAGLFLSLAGLVLLLACMNVTNIVLARSISRQHELAVRAALGAGRSRLISQLLAECLLLALLGGLVGAAIGEWALGVSGSFLRSATSTTNFSYTFDSSFDWRVFTYTFVLTLLAGVFVGIWPVVRLDRVDLRGILHESASDATGGNRNGPRRALVIAQLSGSLALLVVAGLFVRSLKHAEHMYLGFDPRNVVNIMLDPRQIGYDEARSEDFYRLLKERVRSLPGVDSVSLSYVVPLEYPGHSAQVYVDGKPIAVGERPPTISFNSIDPAYFDVMRVPLLRGRGFSDLDSANALPIAIVNQTMAKMLWQGEEPIGRRFSIKGSTGPFIEVAGVAADGQYLFLSPQLQPYFYVPLSQNRSSFGSIQVRSSIPTVLLNSLIQAQIRALAPDLPTIDVRSMEQVVQGLAGLFIFRLAASLSAVLGVVGLVLSIVGLHGVVYFDVSQRAREIGIRMALGAERQAVLALVFNAGLRLIGVGILFGLIFTLLLTQALQKLLIGVSALDPITYIAISVLLAAVTLLACYIPAHLATRVDPAVALRHE